jgi:hypothetical protein
MDDVYGGNTLKAEDLPEGFRAVVVVESAYVQEFKDRDDDRKTERKIVLRFQGKSKGLALNVTNANMMAEIAGSRDYDYWPGKKVVLYRTMTDYSGRRVPALRIDHPMSSPPPPPVRRPAPPPPPPPPAREPGTDDGDGFQATDADVPF